MYTLVASPTSSWPVGKFKQPLLIIKLLRFTRLHLMVRLPPSISSSRLWRIRYREILPSRSSRSLGALQTFGPPLLQHQQRTNSHKRTQQRYANPSTDPCRHTSRHVVACERHGGESHGTCCGGRGGRDSDGTRGGGRHRTSSALRHIEGPERGIVDRESAAGDRESLCAIAQLAGEGAAFARPYAGVLGFARASVSRALLS